MKKSNNINMELRVLRIRNGLTQAELAEKIGYSRSMYTQIEAGCRNGSRKFWDKIQQFFNLSDSEVWCISKNA